MNDKLWTGLIWADMVLVQVPLFIVAYAAVADLFYVSSLALLWWRAIVFVLEALAWAVLCYYVDPQTRAGGDSARARASAVARSQMGYFLVPALVNALLVALLVPERLQFADLWPLSFLENAAPFHVMRSIQIISLVSFLLIVGFWYQESRHTRLHVRISQVQRLERQAAT